MLLLTKSMMAKQRQRTLSLLQQSIRDNEHSMFIIKPCIIYQCNKYLKLAHIYNVAASLYIVAAMMMTSALIFRSKLRQLSGTF
jgi:hypothetical protein